MLLDFHSASSAETTGYQEIAAHNDRRDRRDRRDRLVTAVAASLAVLIVAAIAVLMGMA